MGPIPGLDGFLVRLDNGCVFAFSTQKLQDTEASHAERLSVLEEGLEQLSNAFKALCEDVETAEDKIDRMMNVMMMD